MTEKPELGVGWKQIQLISRKWYRKDSKALVDLQVLYIFQMIRETLKMSDKSTLIPFTEDQWWRVVNNLHVATHILKYKEEVYPRIDDEERCEINIAIEEFENMAYQLYNNFANQFDDNPSARSYCPNPDCKSSYAYFWTDWNYCPKCGTKLEKTGEFWLK